MQTASRSKDRTRRVSKAGRAGRGGQKSKDAKRKDPDPKALNPRHSDAKRRALSVAGGRGWRARERLRKAKKAAEKAAPKVRATTNPFANLGKTTRRYVAHAIEYANRAVADVERKEFNVWMRFAARRFLDDLERAKDPATSFYFDEKLAARACHFIELLPHVEGLWSTPTIVLVEAQIFFVVNLFGFRRRGDGSSAIHDGAIRDRAEEREVDSRGRDNARRNVRGRRTGRPVLRGRDDRRSSEGRLADRETNGRADGGAPRSL